MSATAYTTGPQQQPGPLRRSKESTRLHVVATPATDRSIIPFMLLCALILCAAMAVSLLLHTQMAKTSYTAFEKETQLAILQEENQTLRLELLQVSAPNIMTEKAQDMGMVPGPDRREIVLGPDVSAELASR